jgi:transcription elongation factor Elf1
LKKTVAPLKTSFTCNVCGISQNLDQSVHIKEKLCVTCYAKEQVWNRVEQQIKFYENQLKQTKKLSKIRKQKIVNLRLLNDLIAPNSILDFSEEDMIANLNEMQKSAVQRTLKIINTQIPLPALNSDNIDEKIIQAVIALGKFKRKMPAAKYDEFLSLFSPVFAIKEISPEQIPELFKLLGKLTTIPKIEANSGKYLIKQLPLQKFKAAELLKTWKAYKKAVISANEQIKHFEHLMQFIAAHSQFQTVDDKMMHAIRAFCEKERKEEMKELTDWMLKGINGQEDAALIPNISRFILQNAEQIFYTWYSRILPFNKSQLLIANPKAMSRTDFALQIQYSYTKQELNLLKKILIENTETLIRAKAADRIAKIQANTTFSPEQKKVKIETEEKYLAQDLTPEKLKAAQEKNGATFNTTARFMVLNAEKAFNIVLDDIIRFHYKRLNLTTPVQFITNVGRSSVQESKSKLVATYWISSREW